MLYLTVRPVRTDTSLIRLANCPYQNGVSPASTLASVASAELLPSSLRNYGTVRGILHANLPVVKLILVG
jgi:hypothetical protein